MATFLEDVNAQVKGAPLQRCFHCRKCTAGCPMAVAMDYKPNGVVRMVQQGKRREVLESSAIWLCVSCETCTMRCPNEVDIARMFDVLRQMALESGVRVAEKRVVAFHEAFLDSIEKGGRIHEALMVCAYKLKSGDLFSDVGIGLSMFAKGRLPLLGPRVEGKKEVRRLFDHAKKGGNGAH
ncbi:MAG: 4Fe-4S dicluster domain-containing protein [Thermodesulfobacteriota bacterium]